MKKRYELTCRVMVFATVEVEASSEAEAEELVSCNKWQSIELDVHTALFDAHESITPKEVEP